MHATEVAREVEVYTPQSRLRLLQGDWALEKTETKRHSGFMENSITGWLESCGFVQYAEIFIENDIDLKVLPHLTNEDLRELGVSLGHRKLLLAAITALEEEKGSGKQTRPPEAEPDGETARDTLGDVVRSDAEKRNITVLFVDLVDFTEKTNRIDPEEMRELLQRYQDTVAGEVSRYGGYVAKFLGDGMLIFFGWPTAYEDHAHRAVKAALETITRVRQILEPNGTPLASRAGVASGPIVVGDLVTKNAREEGAATGRILNLAARLQAEARNNTVVIAAENQGLLENAFECAPLGVADIKGFEEAIPLVEVIRERPAESRFRSIYGTTRNRIVGRTNERGLLRQAWSRVTAGRGETVVIAGEAGIGKSRLTEDFLSFDLDAETCDVVRLNASPYFSKSPLHPIIERIAQDAGIVSEEDDDQSAERVRQALALRGLAEGKALPVFAALVAPASEVAETVTKLPPQEQKDLTFQTLVEALKARAMVKPVLLLVEDAHWIDPSTLRIIERIISTCSDIPLMVLITHRTDWSHGWSGFTSDLSTLHLTRLDRESVAELIAQIAGRDLDSAFIDEVLTRTDGVPLYVEEVARFLLDAKVGRASEVPSTLQGAMMARLDAVPDFAKKVALAASVFGREFDRALVAYAMDAQADRVAQGIEELRRAGLVYESGQKRGVYIFRHALIRDTAYQSMISPTRRHYHAAAAGALLSLRAAEIEREPELAANHLIEAQDYVAAFDYLKPAAEKALARSASEEAVYHAERLVAVAENLGEGAMEQQTVARIMLGRSFESIGRLPEALDLLGRTAETARELGWHAHFVEAVYRFTDAALMSSGEIERAHRLCKEAFDLVPEDDEPLRCRMLSQLARCGMHAGDFENSARHSREAVALAEKLNDLRAQFAVRMSRFFAPVIARDASEVENWREQLALMEETADQLDDIERGRDRSLNFYVSTEMGDRAQAERSLDRLKEVGKARNHPQLHWVEQHGRAMLAILDGRFDAAEAFAEYALKIGRTTHGAHVEGVYGAQMFTIRREQERLNEIAPVVKRLLDENPEDAAWKPGFAVIAAELGYHDAAKRILGEIADTGFDLPLDAMYSTTLAYLADVCVLARDHHHARTVYDLLLPYRDITIMAGVTTVCNGAAARRLAGLSALMGDWATSKSMYETALEIDLNMRAVPWIAHTKADYAGALRQHGGAEEMARADRLETEALDMALASGMVNVEKKIRGQLH